MNDLRRARREKGLSRIALAREISVDQQAIKRLEAGVGTMPLLIAVMTRLDYHLTGLARGADLPAQFKQRRKNLGLSLSKVAQIAGLARATVAALENGRGSVRSAVQLLDAIGKNARSRSEQRPYWLSDPAGSRDAKFTPVEFMEAIYASFGSVDLDPCGHRDSPVKAARKIILADGGDGLRDDWSGKVAYMNPPYSSLLRWLRRADDQWSSGKVATVIGLVPARTDSVWFHEHLRHVADIYLLKRRLRFSTAQGRGNPVPFSLMVVFWGASQDQKNKFAELVEGFWLN